MATTFDMTLTRAADSFLLLPGAEWVTYIPRSGSSRKIRAVVVREAVESNPGVTGSARPVFDVIVKNLSTSGISSSEIDTGGDRIRLAPNVNERPIVCHITEIKQHNAGVMTLRVRG